MKFITNIIFQYIIIDGAKGFTYKMQIIFSFVVSFLSLIILPISVRSVGGLTGFVLSCFIIMTQGNHKFFLILCE